MGYCEHCGSGPTCAICGRDDRPIASERAVAIADEIRDWVFLRLDSEYDLEGMEAGRIAHCAEEAALAALAEVGV